jgi:hypothetical protein
VKNFFPGKNISTSWDGGTPGPILHRSWANSSINCGIRVIFYAGGETISAHMTRLKSDTVEGLICLEDCLKVAGKFLLLSSTVVEIKFNFVTNLVIFQNFRPLTNL